MLADTFARATRRVAAAAVRALRRGAGRPAGRAVPAVSPALRAAGQCASSSPTTWPTRWTWTARADWFAELYEPGECDSDLLAAQRHDVLTYLPDDLLVKADIASMAHALELRSPMLDHRVVELGLSLPDELKVDRRRGKRILPRGLRRPAAGARSSTAPRPASACRWTRWLRGPLLPHAARDAAGPVVHRRRLAEAHGPGRD